MKIDQLHMSRHCFTNALANELGEKISSTKAYVWELENKSNARPSADKLLKIADALSVSPEFLINDDLEEQGFRDTIALAHGQHILLFLLWSCEKLFIANGGSKEQNKANLALLRNKII